MKTKIILPLIICSFLFACNNTSSLSNENSSSNVSSNTNNDEAIYFDSNYSGGGDGTLEKPYNNFEVIETLNIEPGMTIKLKCNSIFKGSLKLENLIGTEDNPIIVTSYGEGKNPCIDGNNLEGSGVLNIINSENLIVENLELYDSAKEEGDRRGVLIVGNGDNENQKVETYDNLILNNLYIHDINGFTDAENSGMSIQSKKTGGIHVWSEDGYGRYNNLQIVNCKIENVSNVGIATWYQMIGDTVKKVSPYAENFSNFAHSNILISDNEISFIGKNAIFARNLYKGVIENNIVHDTAIKCVSGNTIVTSYVDGTVIQKNEGYRNMAKGRPSDGKVQDGCMLDADLQSKDTIWQYNYSHDNSFGLFLNCTSLDESKGILDKVIVRYNLSINDKGTKGIIYINYESDGIYVYNNTIVTSTETEYILQSNGQRKAFFYNNLIYNRSEKAKFDLEKSISTIELSNNLIYSENNMIIENEDNIKYFNQNGIYDNPNLKGEFSNDSVMGRKEAANLVIPSENSNVYGNAKEIVKINDFLGNEYENAIGCIC